MDLAHFLYQMFGFYSVIVGLAYVFKRDFFRQAIENYYQNPGLILFTGILTLILGLLIVLNFNVWELGPSGLVTLLGWLMLYKGLMRIFAPFSGKDFALKLISGTGAYVTGGISIALGVWLLWAGFAQ